VYYYSAAAKIVFAISINAREEIELENKALTSISKAGLKDAKGYAV